MKTLAAFALTAALSSAIPVSTVLAETISLGAPLSGATLRSGEISLSAYYLEAAEGGFEVVVTYVDGATPYQPRRIVMVLRDGDQARFGLPDHPGVLYAFSRAGDAVTISGRAGGSAGFFSRTMPTTVARLKDAGLECGNSPR
jgi:hypothetical protein